MPKFNVVGQFYGAMGIPQHTREIVTSLINLGADVSAIQLFPGQNTSLELPSTIKSALKNKPDASAPGLIFWYPDAYAPYSIFSKTLGYFIFEYTKIPKRYIELINGSGLDGICTASWWGKKVLLDNGVTIPVFVIPGGVNTKVFNTKDKELPTDVMRFLHIGKFEVRKSTVETITAFNNATKGDPKIRLTLSIDNPHLDGFSSEAYLRELSKTLKYPTTNIDIVHFVDDITRLYKSHHCAIFPTKAEGIGLPIVEAMACGMPVIVPCHTGTSQYVTQSNAIVLTNTKEAPIYDKHFFPEAGALGVWHEPSVDEIQEKIEWVINNYDKAKLIGDAAAEYIASSFTWEQSTEKLIGVS